MTLRALELTNSYSIALLVAVAVYAITTAAMDELFCTKKENRPKRKVQTVFKEFPKDMKTYLLEIIPQILNKVKSRSDDVSMIISHIVTYPRYKCGRLIDDGSNKSKLKCNICATDGIKYSYMDSEHGCRMCNRPITKRQVFCSKECAINFWAELNKKYKTRKD